MSVRPGDRLGPYEIQAAIGAGGMGVVYRARDTRLGRDVAVKILPVSFASDPERLRRFEREARAAGALNHPNLLAIYDVGTHDGVPFLVTELLEGDSLRERLASGQLPPRKAVEYGIQIVHGLAAAHNKGIVHRDLKPANVFVTRDGRVKILDFGIAKMREQVEALQTTATIEAPDTQPGVLLGTTGYMSPEQVRGLPLDHRSDIFSFGIVLYEMLSGHRPFDRPSAVETLGAILNDDPPELSGTASVPGQGLARIVRRCLEKSPEERFQSARDLGFALQSSTETGTAKSQTPVTGTRRLLRWFAPAAIGVLLAATSFWAGARSRLSVSDSSLGSPSYQQLTFRRGTIRSARFGREGQTVFYGAAWDGKVVEAFTTGADGLDSRSLGLGPSDVMDVLPQSQLAVLTGVATDSVSGWVGTLATIGIHGGAPREIAQSIKFADWTSDGSEVAVVRDDGFRARLEFPIGNTVAESRNLILYPRISPKGDRVAYFAGVEGIDVRVVDRSGKVTILVSNVGRAAGLAWAASGQEIWFSADTSANPGPFSALQAVDLAGKHRTVLRLPQPIALYDIANDGRVLLGVGAVRSTIMVLAPGETVERDLSWFDDSQVVDLSDDGRSLLFNDRPASGGEWSTILLRRTDGSPAVRLGQGVAVGLSPDGKWVAARRSDRKFVLLPTGEGQPIVLDPKTESETLTGLFFNPDGSLIGTETQSGKNPRSLYFDFASRKFTTLPDPSLAGFLAPDRKHSLVSDGKDMWIHEVGTKAPPRKWVGPANEFPIGWTADSRGIFVTDPSKLPCEVYRVDIDSRKRQLWKRISLADPAGVSPISQVDLSADGRAYAYSFRRMLQDLYVVSGLK